MISKKSLQFGIGLLLACLVSAMGQDQAPPSLPKDFALKRLPEFATWSMTGMASKTAEPNGKAPSPRSTTVTKTKGIYQEVEVDETGKKTVKWHYDHYTVLLVPSGESMIAGANAYVASDFPEFGWISEKNFKRAEKFNDSFLFVFEGKATFPGGQVSAAAWIDADTLLPLSLTVAGERRIYRYGKGPDTMLSVPPAAQQVVNAQRAALAPLLRH